jgi:hypothetical protein
MSVIVGGFLLFLVVWLLAALAFFQITPDQPVGLGVLQIRSELNMADILTYAVSVNPVVDADVVSRELSVYVDGSEAAREVRSYPSDAAGLGTVSVPQNSAVVLQLVDIDDAGNRSEPAVLEFTATDTIAPAVPGNLGVTLVDETSDGEPTT